MGLGPLDGDMLFWEFLLDRLIIGVGNELSMEVRAVYVMIWYEESRIGVENEIDWMLRVKLRVPLPRETLP